MNEKRRIFEATKLKIGQIIYYNNGTFELRSYNKGKKEYEEFNWETDEELSKMLQKIRK